MATLVCTSGSSAAPIGFSGSGTVSGSFYWNLSGIPLDATITGATVAYTHSGSVIFEPSVYDTDVYGYSWNDGLINAAWNAAGVAWIQANIGTANASGYSMCLTSTNSGNADLLLWQNSLTVGYSPACYDSTLVVQVLESCSGTPVTGQVVSGNSTTDTTDVYGVSVFTPLGTGTYTYQTSYQGSIFSGSFTATCTGGVWLRQLAVTPSGGCVGSGTCTILLVVYNAATMLPVSGATSTIGASSSTTSSGGLVYYYGASSPLTGITVTGAAYQTWYGSGSCYDELASSGGIFIALQPTSGAAATGHLNPYIYTGPYLVEDGDGIVPITIIKTDDWTPTFEWGTILGTTSGSSDYYVYRFSLYRWTGSAYTFVSSGATNLNDQAVQVGQTGRYQLLLYARDSISTTSPFATAGFIIPDNHLSLGGGGGAMTHQDSCYRQSLPTLPGLSA